jgi:hypothetical protein
MPTPQTRLALARHHAPSPSLHAQLPTCHRVLELQLAEVKPLPLLPFFLTRRPRRRRSRPRCWPGSASTWACCWGCWRTSPCVLTWRDHVACVCLAAWRVHTWHVRAAWPSSAADLAQRRPPVCSLPARCPHPFPTRPVRHASRDKQPHLTPHTSHLTPHTSRHASHPAGGRARLLRALPHRAAAHPAAEPLPRAAAGEGGGGAAREQLGAGRGALSQ